MTERRLVLVVGVGRSGTSLLAGILGQVGLRIPQPEVQADATNPRGFGEPRWVVAFHKRLMRAPSVNVHVFDGRPDAFTRTAAVAEDPAVKGDLRAWLEQELAAPTPAVVVKDPRSGWFLGLWTACSQDLGVPMSTLTMLRHPVEVVLSARRSYGAWQSDVSRAAGWLNQMLEIEHATRGRSRAFVRHDELLDDWAPTVRRAGAQIALPALDGLDAADHQAVDGFVDPGLHRNRAEWEALELPVALRDLLREAWEALLALSGAAGEDPSAYARLDGVHDAYRRLYADAAAIAQSSAIASRRRGRRRPPPPPPSRADRLRAAVVRRLPAGVRQSVSARRRARRPADGGTGRSGA